jgi:4'-phosphopantetheinyl transferase
MRVLPYLNDAGRQGVSALAMGPRFLVRTTLDHRVLQRISGESGGLMPQLASSHAHAIAPSRYMELRSAFNDALPTPDWASATSAGIVVALIELQDWQPWLPDARNLIDAADRWRAERRRFAADRNELTLGYALHRLLLAAALGTDATDVPLIRDERGCPRLADRSLWTSLSHVDGCIALAVTAIGPVGIDIELATRAAVMPEIAERVCHPADAAALAGLVPPAWNAALLELWVRKEAFLKAAGVGLEREMSDFSASEDRLLPLLPPAGEMTQLRMLDAGSRWAGAVSGPPGIPVESAWLRPNGNCTTRNLD